jgi:hypothetical protein
MGLDPLILGLVPLFNGAGKGAMADRKMVVKAYVDETLYVNAHYQAHVRGQSLSTWIEQLLRDAVVVANGGRMLRSLGELEGQLEMEAEGVR